MYDEVQPFITIGTGIDSTAADDVSSVTGSNALLSNPEQLFDAYYEIDNNYAVYEDEGIPTALSYGMVAPPLSDVGRPWYTGVWSDPISDADGNIIWTLTVALSDAHTSALTVSFIGPMVTGQIVFKNGNTTVATENITTPSNTVTLPTVRTFDTIIITVSTLSQPYRHVRVAEIEFGASKTFSSDELTGTITLIEQADFLQETLPIAEMDFSLINIDGKYDIDNLDANGKNVNLDEVSIGTPVTLSFTLYESGTQTTKVMGKYYIIRHDAQEDKLEITAQDARAILQNRASAIALSTGTTIAMSISAVLSASGVPHIIDNSASAIYPDSDYTFSRNENIVKQMLYIQQRYQIYCVPERDGIVHIMYGEPTGSGDDITQDVLITYPKPSLATLYNHITIDYGVAGSRQQYDLDMRTDPDEVIKSYAIDNPLILTSAQAQALASRVQSAMFTQQYLAEAIGDPDLDLFADVHIDGRWSSDDPLEYRVQSIEYTYDGGLTMRVEGVR